jgi:tetratricopeptide (TPR) repeat protein
LDGEEQVLFRRLAVFVSGCTLEAVDTVCLGRNASREVQAESPLTPQGDEFLPFIVRRSSVDLLESLVDQSLLKSSDVNGEPRFEMLETLREYALERLIDSGEAEAIRWRHANFFLALAEEAEPKMRSTEQVAWLNRLEMEYGNLRAALTWFKEKVTDEQEEPAMPVLSEAEGPVPSEAEGPVPSKVEGSLSKEPALPVPSEAEGSLPKGLRLVAALYRFWLTRGSWSEGREWLTQFLALSTTSPRTAVRAKALNRAGLMAWWQRDYASARALQVESLEIYQELNDKHGVAASLFGLGRVARGQGDYASARASYEESLAIRRDLGDRWGIANTLLSLGVVVFFFQDDLAPARSLLEESLAIWRELDIKSGIAATLSWLGRVLQRQGNYEQAEVLCLESLALFRELGDRLGLAYTLHNLGCAALCQDDRGRAATHFTESLALYRELERQDGIIECLAGLAAVAGAEGQLEWAAQLFGAAEALLEATGAHLAAADRAEWDRNLAAVRAQLDEAIFAAAWAEGQARDLDATVAELLVELGG